MKFDQKQEGGEHSREDKIKRPKPNTRMALINVSMGVIVYNALYIFSPRN